MYCARCGSYASQRVKGLKLVCTGKPTTSKKYGLSRILAGRHPVPGKEWPGHEHDPPPFHFLKGGDNGRMTVVPSKSQLTDPDDGPTAEDTNQDGGDIDPPDIQDLLALIDAEEQPSDIDSEAGEDAVPSDSQDVDALPTDNKSGGQDASGQMSDSD